MLNPEWMRQRDRRIRHAVRDAKTAEDTDAALDSEFPEDEAGLDDSVGEVWAEETEAWPEDEITSPVDEIEAIETPENVIAAEQEEYTEVETATVTVDISDAELSLDNTITVDEAEVDVQASESPEDSLADEVTEDTEASLDAHEVAGSLDVPLSGLRERLQAVISRQAQLPLDFEEKQAVSEQLDGSPKETRETLIRRLLDPTLTLDETAILLNVCPTTVRRYTNRGVLRCYRTPGNQRRFHLTDVLEFMERQSRAE